jgi:hypothetical protein
MGNQKERKTNSQQVATGNHDCALHKVLVQKVKNIKIGSTHEFTQVLMMVVKSSLWGFYSANYHNCAIVSSCFSKMLVLGVFQAQWDCFVYLPK